MEPSTDLEATSSRGAAPSAADAAASVAEEALRVDQAPRPGRLAPWLGRGGQAFLRTVEGLTGDDLEDRLRRVAVERNEVGFDRFGFDPDTARYVLAVASLLHRRYFRSLVFDIARVPAGRVLIVGNHSGQLPFDAAMIAAALMLDAEPPRLPRSMVEKWAAELPFVSTLFTRAGQVVGVPANARRLLEEEHCLLVFPEGVRGIAKTYSERYALRPFGLGFMRLALETKTPIVPVALIGAEEQYVSVANAERLAKLLHMPVFPVVPQLFFGMLAPLPTRYRIYFGEPMSFDGDPDDDDAIIERKVAIVRDTIQAMVDRGVAERTSLFG